MPEPYRDGVDLTPDSLMPYGKHVDTPMRTVPADYLLWVDRQMGRHARGRMQLLVRGYVSRNRALLELRAKNEGSSSRGFGSITGVP